ncbi:MAG: DegT/DnrJ/EryC1/StrS family aminotransferase [Gallionella sp.]|nr:DegT/DnrJ/EryC1/StrS family aminotransferase [Gallionella sp.]
MIPRKRLDIAWQDLGIGGLSCLFPPDRCDIQARVEQSANTLATLSVRTGFDLLLQHLALPRGSEVLMSAITIRDMVSIIEHHGLCPVPIDLDPKTCALDLEHLRRSISSNTKIILVAHLFGSRMSMDGIMEVAQQHPLMVIEDCAQAFMADGYRGHPRTDVTFFSFGSIKTATALGGALLIFRDKALCQAVRLLQSKLPLQSHRLYFGKILKYAALKLLSYPATYTTFVALCKLFHTSHDRLISQSVRGFAGGELIQKIRYQPSTALLTLLQRRLQRYTPADLQARIRAAQQLSHLLPDLYIPARDASHHTHWVFPLQNPYPDQLVQHLLEQGFDATRGASSMFAIPCNTPLAAQQMMQQMLYLPVDAGVSDEYVRKLASAILAYENTRHGKTNHEVL